MSKPKLPPVEVLGPFGPVLVSGAVFAALKPDPSFHYGHPLATQDRPDGPICVYLSGNGPQGERVSMVARQHATRATVETRIQPMDFVTNCAPFDGACHITKKGE